MRGSNLLISIYNPLNWLASPPIKDESEGLLHVFSPANHILYLPTIYTLLYLIYSIPESHASILQVKDTSCVLFFRVEQPLHYIHHLYASLPNWSCRVPASSNATSNRAKKHERLIIFHFDSSFVDHSWKLFCFCLEFQFNFSDILLTQSSFLLPCCITLANGYLEAEMVT